MLSTGKLRCHVGLSIICSLAIWPNLVLAQNQGVPPDFMEETNQQAVLLGNELISLNDRLAALERLVSQLVAQNDELRHESDELVAQFERFKMDSEARMADVEAQISAVPISSDSANPINPIVPQIEMTQPDQQELDPYEEAKRYADEQNWLNAEIALDAFISNNPTDPRVPRARYELGMAYMQQGQPAQAARMFLDLFQSGDASEFGADNLFSLARALEQLEEVDERQMCSVFYEIENSYSDQITSEGRQNLLEKKLQYSCSE